MYMLLFFLCYKYICILIGVASGLLILAILWFFAMRKYKRGRNFLAIFFFPLILIDFVLDIIVLAVHGRDLKWFYICWFVLQLIFSCSFFLIVYILTYISFFQ